MNYKIAIWGAGKFGRYVLKLLKEKDLDIVCFIDKNLDLVNLKIDGINVIPPDYLQVPNSYSIDYILIAFMNGISIYDQLSRFRDIKFGFVKDCVLIQQLDLKSDLLNDRNIFWIDSTEKPLLRALEANIVDYCNLNCKGCSHFSNLYKKGDMIAFETYCKDLWQISQKINIMQFNMLGGEVLLNEKLNEYIDYTRKTLPYTEIWLVTNGLLLPKQEEKFFNSCIKNKVGIDITEYEPTARIKNQVIDILHKYKIPFRIRENIKDFGKNIDLSGSANKVEAVKKCRENKCHFFRSGKLYKCPFEALGNKFFRYYDLNIRLDGGTDIYDEGLDWKSIVFQLENEPVDACRFCGKQKRFMWEVSNNPSMDYLM